MEPKFPEPLFGRRLFEAAPAELRQRPLVVSQPEPWELVRSFLPGKAALEMASDMSREHLETLAQTLPAAKSVWGVGGGSACDTAKYLAWRRGLPLVLVPTVLSVDAAFTRAVAVREGWRVRYLGAVVPRLLLVDFELLEKAPPALNRAGAGDILSIYTALWDWRQAGRRNNEPFREDLAAEAWALFLQLEEQAPAICANREEGLRLLTELFRAEVRLCERHGNSRPEEGSEHHLAYCVEAECRRPFIHGRLVALCTQAAAFFQGQDWRRLRRLCGRLGLESDLPVIGLTQEEFGRAIGRVTAFVREEKELLPGIFHWLGEVSRERVGECLRALEV